MARHLTFSFFSFLQLGRGVRGDCRTGLSGDTAHPSLHSSHHPACPPEEPQVAWDRCDSSEKYPTQTGTGPIRRESGNHKGRPKTLSPTLSQDQSLYSFWGWSIPMALLFPMAKSEWAHTGDKASTSIQWPLVQHVHSWRNSAWAGEVQFWGRGRKGLQQGHCFPFLLPSPLTFAMVELPSLPFPSLPSLSLPCLYTPMSHLSSPPSTLSVFIFLPPSWAPPQLSSLSQPPGPSPEVCLDLTECWTSSEVEKPWPSIPRLPLLSTAITGYWRNKSSEGRKACRLDLKCWSLWHKRREFGQPGRELPRGERTGKMERLRARGFTTLSCQSLLSIFGFWLCYLGLFLQVVTSGECLHSSLTLTNIADLCTYPWVC